MNILKKFLSIKLKKLDTEIQRLSNYDKEVSDRESFIISKNLK